MKYFSQFMLFLIAVAVLLGLQYQYWLGKSGRAELDKLHADIQVQQQLNDQKVDENKVLLADVNDLKNGLEAVEEHARLDLGLIKPGETFVQLSTAPVTHTTQPTPPINPDDAIESIP
ncbi:cell division protein FtsB [Psychrobacter sp. YP14]|uniref:Cell division protein FtsB n=3 Tax=Psychrobacter TaxID=497 RepID=A0A844M107_9GAMM|nr:MULTISPECIES: septum formation initiator family protein [Psychrobacter]AWT49405.1 cell division protein FtsB [Psychrobacter sp. YP14]MUG32197.1 cell division protein FtsB [Psychrobacter sanguinis]UNK04783.1 septum formation initiator family protein [Psychrobacter sp. PraFG1]